MSRIDAALTDRLGVSMSAHEWQSGWNDVFVDPYPGVQRALNNLSAHLPLYAFTNTNPTHEAAWRARYSQALVQFEEIFVSSTIGMRKPDRAAFEWVAAAMETAPERILFLDDKPENIAGARRAGLTTAQVRGEAEVPSALDDYKDSFNG